MGSDGKLHVPARPIIPFIEGDGTGRDIWQASQHVFDKAMEKAYGGKRAIEWMEVWAGEKSLTSSTDWLPDETVEALKEYWSDHQGAADHRGPATGYRHGQR